MSKFSNLKVDRGTLQVDEKARMYRSTSQADLVHGVWTKVDLDSSKFDTAGRFADGKFTVGVEGYYLLIGSVGFQNTVANKGYYAGIVKNGTVYQTQALATLSDLAYTLIIPLSTVSYLLVDDYIELWAESLAGVDTVDIYGDDNSTHLEVILLST